MNDEEAIKRAVQARVAAERLESQGVISANELLETDFEEQTPIIAGGILDRPGSLVLAAEGGEGKSLITIEWSIRFVMGWMVLGLDVPTTRNVIIFQTENSLRQIQKRLRRILEGFEISNLPKKLFFAPFNAKYDLMSDETISRMAAQIEACRADVYIIDPLVSFHDKREDANSEMRSVLDNLTLLSRKMNASSIVVHHFNKADEREIKYRLRGASAIVDWADTVLAFKRKKHETKKLLELTFTKVRNGPVPRPLLVERNSSLICEICEEDILVPMNILVQVLVSSMPPGRVPRSPYKWVPG